MEQSNPKGAGFLKVVGILMIIFGAIALIVSIIAILGIAAIITAASQSGTTLEELGINSFMLYAGGICMLLGAVAEFVTGIIGCVNCKKPDKANVCLTWGIIVAVLCVLGQIVTVIGGGQFNVVSTLLGLVMPVLFIIGAVRNKQ